MCKYQNVKYIFIDNRSFWCFDRHAAFDIVIIKINFQIIKYVYKLTNDDNFDII